MKIDTNTLMVFALIGGLGYLFYRETSTKGNLDQGMSSGEFQSWMQNNPPPPRNDQNWQRWLETALQVLQTLFPNGLKGTKKSQLERAFSLNPGYDPTGFAFGFNPAGGTLFNLNGGFRFP